MVFSRFTEELEIANPNQEVFSDYFALLVNTMKINLNELAKSMGFDPSYLSRIRKYFIKTVQCCLTEDMVLVLSQEEYGDSPLTLSLSGAFYEHEIYYTYEEYLEHYKQTKAFAEKYQNYNISAQHTRIFKNIQIQMKHNEWVMI